VWVVLVLLIAGAFGLWNVLSPKTKTLVALGGVSASGEAATLVYRNYYKIKTINGAKAKGLSTGFAKSATVLLPPGEYTIGFDFSDEWGIPFIFTWGGKAKGCTLTCVLEAGQTYAFKSTEYGTFLGPWFKASTITTTAVPFDPDAELKAYLKKGWVTQEKLVNK
jgi:hypothetical protein